MRHWSGFGRANQTLATEGREVIIGTESDSKTRDEGRRSEMKKRLFGVTVIGLCILFLSAAAFSQLRETGVIHGYVQDEQGEPLPGGTITCSGANLLGGARTFVTDRNGYYRFRSLPPGPYTVSAEIPGFAKLVREDIQLHANLTLTADFKMVQATVKEEVVVTARTPTVDLTSNTTGGVVMTETLLTALPIAKTYGALVKTAVGVGIWGDDAYVQEAYGLGGYGQGNGYQFDGINMKSAGGGMLRGSPDFNIVKESSFQGLGLPAEFGGFTGAFLSTVTKSGSNKVSTLDEIRYNGRTWNSQNLGNYAAADFQNPSAKEQKYTTNRLFDVGLQLGGKIIRDRLWFFISGEWTQSTAYPLSYSGTTTTKAPRAFLKLSYQLNPSNHLSTAAHYQNSDTDNTNASASYTPEAQSSSTSPGWIANAAWTSVFSPTTFLDVKVGYSALRTRTIPRQGYDVPGNYNYADSRYHDNAPSYGKSTDRSVHASAHLSQYLEKFLVGSHDLKIGSEAEFYSPTSTSGKPGNQFTYYQGTVPMSLQTLDGPAYIHHIFRNIVAFAQDSWSVTRRLTLNLGLRYDNYWYESSPDRGVVFNGGNFSPRLGLTYDLLGDRKNVVKFHYGNYYQAIYQNYFSSTDTTRPGAINYLWNGTDWYEISRSVPADPTLVTVDPNVKMPYTRELSGAFERELFRDASLSVSFYYKKVMRFFGSVNYLAEWEQRTRINPGPDNIVGTADDLGETPWYFRLNPSQNKMLITNPRKGLSNSLIDDPKLSSKGFQIQFNKRFSNRWQMIAAYMYTVAEGNIDQGDMGGAVNDPNAFIRAYGQRDQFYGMPHQFKLSGNVVLPLEISFGFIASYLSGNTMRAMYYFSTTAGTITQALWQMGTKKYDPVALLDLRAEKRFPLRAGMVTVFVDLFNALNNDIVTGRYLYASPTLFNKISQVTPPRQIRAGFRFIF